MWLAQFVCAPQFFKTPKALCGHTVYGFQTQAKLYSVHSASEKYQKSWQADKAILHLHLKKISQRTTRLSEKDALLLAVETVYAEHFHGTANILRCAAATLYFQNLNPCRADETICFSRVRFVVINLNIFVRGFVRNWIHTFGRECLPVYDAMVPFNGWIDVLRSGTLVPTVFLSWRLHHQNK
jgi:hypothetical protein